jgi:ligand-binding SRPBCC domain-containing protein
MPLFETATELSRPVADVFEFLCRPANLVTVSPPELNLTLIESPERLQLGSRIVLQVKAWGLSQRLTNEVTVYQPNVLFTDEQREGPFRRWRHTHQLLPVTGGTRMIDRIEFEAPGGLLGLVLSATRVQAELGKAFAIRSQKMAELLAPA